MVPVVVDDPRREQHYGGQMGIFDKAKDALGDHASTVDAGIERAGDFVDDKTGGKYAEQVDQGQTVASEKLEDFLKDDPDNRPA